jgi:hypothetical protein
MQNIVTLGRRLIPIEQIAMVEPFDPAANPQFKPEKTFKARVVLINRDSVLTEDTSQEFAKAHGFRMLPEDAVGINPMIKFKIETFAATDSFRPARPYATRLMWLDQDGNEQSKLLLSKPETVIAVALRGEAEAAPDTGQPEPPRRPAHSPRRRAGAKAQHE